MPDPNDDSFTIVRSISSIELNAWKRAMQPFLAGGSCSGGLGLLLDEQCLLAISCIKLLAILCCANLCKLDTALIIENNKVLMTSPFCRACSLLFLLLVRMVIYMH
jgi:hypothetical protein